MSDHAKVITCGCRYNRYESEEILSRIRGGSGGKLVVINSCSVTRASEAKSRKAVRRAIRENRGASIVVAGCWAELKPEEVSSIKGVDLVLGNEEKFYVENFLPGRGRERTGGVKDAEKFVETNVGPIENRTAAYLKIQNGCGESCSFCVVRLVRGKSRSAPPEFVLRRVDSLINAGAKEIVLTGINVGAYGRDFCTKNTKKTKNTQYKQSEQNKRKPSLARLLEKLILKKAVRFRLSSINPLDVTDEILSIMADSPQTICRHLHVPMQSGSDAILRKMDRPYSAAQYREKIEEIVQRLPGIGLGCDVMAGFPGETEDDFIRTERMLSDLPFSYAHVFTYSPREKTPAFEMKETLTHREKKGRVEKLKKIAAAKNLSYKKSLMGKTLEVLVETRNSANCGSLTGKSDTFLQVEFHGGRELEGQLTRVRITGVKDNGLMAV
ncbi:MAG: tRNA (N(6)-L-threonylcarbamoyladenosine(37)-C(2))-methylthiotransferase MtaB [bacterium]|nr:MAG: tRNA (N(6)-L-threonylcarbamoyladenosine(37)-C(2))-methylthiotransferase MtaB [bacterium]